MLQELSSELNVSISCYKEIMIEKRAIHLAQTPQFVQHVLHSNNTTSQPPNNNNNNNLFFKHQSSQFNLNSIINDTIDLDQLAQQSILNNEIPKRYEIWFKNTKWKLNEPDGKTGCAQFLMKNFLYTKVTNQQELDCVEHNLEIESCKLQDLTVDCDTKNEITILTGSNFRDVLSGMFDTTKSSDSAVSQSSMNKNKNDLSLKKDENENDDPSEPPESTSSSSSLNTSSISANSNCSSSYAFNELKNNEDEVNHHHHHRNTKKSLLLDDSTLIPNEMMNAKNSNSITMIRIYCKERPPVGNIAVFEHLELNVSPLSIKLTNRFFNLLIKFFFENHQNNNASSNNLSLSNANNNSGLNTISFNRNSMNNSSGFSHRNSYSIMNSEGLGK